MTKAIEISNLIYTYPDGTPALKDISLSVDKGSRVALLGPNGAGKSTLLLHLNGIHLPQRGRIRVFGQELSKQTEMAIREKIGLVFQDPDDQVFATTVWDDVAFGPLNMNLTKHEVEHRVADALNAVMMWELKDKAPHHLSFGQKKRVAIAGVLAMDPEVVVLDEPTAYLDPGGQEVLMTILEEFHRRGKTLILATHDIDLAAEWADAVIIVKDGRTLVQGGTDLLADISLVREANLRLPTVSRVFSNFSEFQGAKLPKTVEEAVQILKKLLNC